jgi:CRISPR system Cascade subunit CasD
MNGEPNTVFLRLEGPLQSWGDNSKFVIRRTMDAPTKSGIIGLISSAMGLSRQAVLDYLPELNNLTMGVRIDRAGTRWWDYHTVGAKVGLLKAEGGIKRTGGPKGPIETLITRREYLADASFLVALQGDASVVQEVADALMNPKWPLFLGRKSCPPSRPLLDTEHPAGAFQDLRSALAYGPWRQRLGSDRPEEEKIELTCLIEWRSSKAEPIAPPEAEVWYDSPVSFDPPVHEARLVVWKSVTVKVGSPLQRATPAPPRPRADYRNSEYRKIRAERLGRDHHLCVFCKSPATTVQHVTYRHAGGEERLDELRSLCRLCHDAVTMIEYGLGMGLDRINPEELRWRDQIIRKRAEIIEFRSLETRRRRLQPEEVE